MTGYIVQVMLWQSDGRYFEPAGWYDRLMECNTGDYVMMEIG